MYRAKGVVSQSLASGLFHHIKKEEDGGGSNSNKQRKLKEKYFFFSENTVKSAKELVTLKQQRQQVDGDGQFSLESVGENVNELRREQYGIKQKINALEENVKMVLEVMLSRQPTVQRI